MEQNILNSYRIRVSTASGQAEKYKKLLNAYSLYRLGLFALFIVLVCIAISLDETLIIILSFLILSVGFSWLVNQQNQFEALKNYFEDVKRVSENEIDSI